MPKWRRTRLIINPDFQFRLIGYVATVAILLIGILYAADAYFIHRFHEVGIASGLPPDHAYFQLLAEQRSFQIKIFGITSAVMLAVLFFGGILISHRIAGPVLRVCMHLDELSKGGPLRDIKFRNKDFFPELADAFNHAFLRFRELEPKEQSSEPKRKWGG